PTKMAVKRSRGNAGNLRGIGNGEPAQAALGDETLGGLDQRLAQIAVMVTALVEGTVPRSHADPYRESTMAESLSHLIRSPTRLLKDNQARQCSIRRPRNVPHFSSSARAMNSSALCAWSIVPGPITTDGIPAAANRPASVP